MTRQQFLIIAPAGWDQQLIADYCSYSIEYRYVEDYPADGMYAWRAAKSASGETIDVAARCHAYGGGFSQHALNRLVSQAILAFRPKALVIIGLTGCTVDLLRVAELLGLPSLLILGSPAESLDSLGENTRRWLQSSLSACRYVFPAGQSFDDRWPAAWLESNATADSARLPLLLDSLAAQPAPARSYHYAVYEFCQRDHPLLVNMQSGDASHFEGCNNVLDLACGVGIFLDCLRQRGIDARGVERDSNLAAYARGMGLDVDNEDALVYLENTNVCHDGIYCSHFVEHLPIEMVQRLLQLMADRLSAGGMLVLVFPDPESIRSQLLGFWRDPEHVRFYHPELVITMAATVGLELEWSSHDAQPHRVVPFAEVPPQVTPTAPLSPFTADPGQGQRGLLERVLGRLGLVTERRFRNLEQRLQQWSELLHNESRRYIAASEQLQQRTDTLWDVNQTWVWNDNVTIRLRKAAR